MNHPRCLDEFLLLAQQCPVHKEEHYYTKIKVLVITEQFESRERCWVVAGQAGPQTLLPQPRTRAIKTG